MTAVEWADGVWGFAARSRPGFSRAKLHTMCMWTLQYVTHETPQWIAAARCRLSWLAEQELRKGSR